MKKDMTAAGCIANMSDQVERLVMQGLFPEVEREKVVGYIGERGCFCHDSALRYFSRERIDRFVPYKTREHLLSDLRNGYILYGVLPLEHTGQGRNFTVLNDLYRTKVYLIGEMFFALASVGVYGPKAFQDCPIQRIFMPLQTLLAEWQPEERNIQIIYTNTLQEAAERASAQKGGAVLTHPFGARLYKLYLQSCIGQYCASDLLRFGIVTKSQPFFSEQCDLLCRIPLKRGETVFDVLGRLEEAGGRITRVDTQMQETVILFVTVRCYSGDYTFFKKMLNRGEIIGIWK